MKTILLSCILLTFFVFTTQAQTEKAKEQLKAKTEKLDKAPPKKGKHTFSIKTSAQCDMCKERMEEALAFEKGIKAANLDVDSQVLSVTYNAKKTSEAQIRTKVSEIGYDADEVKAVKTAHDKLPKCCQKGGHGK